MKIFFALWEEEGGERKRVESVVFVERMNDRFNANVTVPLVPRMKGLSYSSSACARYFRFAT